MNNHILIVEDEKEIRDSIVEILVQSGYKVSNFPDVAKAEEFLESNSVDLIISDIMLPGKSGWDFIDDVKSKESLSIIPFIFLTAKSEPSELRAGMNYGADDYITKPFRSKDLLKSVELRLNKKKSFDNKINYFLKSIAEYVPHELRTPLVSILGYPEFILDNYQDLSEEEVQQMIRNILEAGKRMQETVEKFILYSELESVKLKENVKKIYERHKTEEIEAVIRMAAYNIAEKYERKSDLEIDILNSPVRIADYLLAEVIKQVVDNAFKFSKPGTKIKINSDTKDDMYRLRVSDNGRGMKKEQIKNIEAFIQFDRDNFNQRGNGLGLALVKKILSLNNNEIIVESNQSKGTDVVLSFHVYKPK